MSSCIRLTGSSTCPGFQDQYINPQTLQAGFPFFSNVYDVASFDTAYAEWLRNPEGFRRQKYLNQLGCTGYTNPYALQWTQTFYCGQFTQIAFSDSCYPANALRRMTCQQTCLQNARAEVGLVGNLSVCPGNTLSGGSTARQYQLTQDLVQCTTWATLASNDPQTCVLGDDNEPNCGFGPTPSSSQLCNYCNPSNLAPGSLLPRCCIGVRTDLSSCGFAGLAATQASSAPPTQTTATFVPSSSIAASISALLLSFSSQAADQISSASVAAARSAEASVRAGQGLSAGAKAGIAIGSIIGALLLLALLAALFILCRRRKGRDDESRGGVTGLFASRSRERSMSIADTDRSYMTEKKGGLRNFLVGSSAVASNRVSREGQMTDDGHGTGGAGSSPNPGAANGATGSGSGSRPGTANASGAGAGAGAATGLGLGALTGAAAGAAAAGAGSKERPMSGETIDSAASADDGRNLVDSYGDQYTNTTITPGSDVLAIYAYNPTLPDELHLDPDMIVTIRKIFDDGWAVGAVTRMPDGSKPDAPTAAKEGAFPLICTCNAAADALMTDGATSTRSASGPNGSIQRRGGSSSAHGRSLLDPTEISASFNSAVSRIDDDTSSSANHSGSLSGSEAAAPATTPANGSNAHAAYGAQHEDGEENLKDQQENKEAVTPGQTWLGGLLGGR